MVKFGDGFRSEALTCGDLKEWVKPVLLPFIRNDKYIRVSTHGGTTGVLVEGARRHIRVCKQRSLLCESEALFACFCHGVNVDFGVMSSKILRIIVGNKALLLTSSCIHNER
jgi:hypothetical protein